MIGFSWKTRKQAGVLALALVFVALLTCSCHQFRTGRNAPEGLAAPNPVEILNALRNDINSKYGFRNGSPRINLGPCGRFAKAFREQWNAKFMEKVTIVFVMSDEQ